MPAIDERLSRRDVLLPFDHVSACFMIAFMFSSSLRLRAGLPVTQPRQSPDDRQSTFFQRRELRLQLLCLSLVAGILIGT